MAHREAIVALADARVALATIAHNVGCSFSTDWAPTDDRDLYAELGQPLSEMSLVNAYPWPREVPFYEALFDMLACKGAVLWLYRHGSAPKLSQKV